MPLGSGLGGVYISIYKFKKKVCKNIIKKWVRYVENNKKKETQ